MNDSIPNPEYEKLVAEGEGWDPFAHMTDAYRRIMIGPAPRVIDLLCPQCKKLSDVKWIALGNDSYATECTECGYRRTL